MREESASVTIHELEWSGRLRVQSGELVVMQWRRGASEESAETFRVPVALLPALLQFANTALPESDIRKITEEEISALELVAQNLADPHIGHRSVLRQLATALRTVFGARAD